MGSKLTKTDIANILCLRNGLEIYNERLKKVDETTLNSDNKATVKSMILDTINKIETELEKYKYKHV